MINEERITTVTLRKGVDSDRFLEEMTSKYGDADIPRRSVPIHNERKHSVSNFEFVLSYNEAEALDRDPRVRAIQWGTREQLGIIQTPDFFEPLRNYARNNDESRNSDYDWGKIACVTDDPSVWTSSGDLFINRPYSLTGEGVDVVVMDSGIQVNHPEFFRVDRNVSRIQLIDWPAAAGLAESITQNPNYYSGTDNQIGHGTHVASTIAGRLYGWAKDAAIYSLTCVGNGYIFDIDDAFALLRGWHNNKTNGRPTIVNMSWGYSRAYSAMNRTVYRGIEYTQQPPVAAYGQVDPQGYDRVPLQVASVDSDIEDCIADGIIMVASAGNTFHLATTQGEADWNNYVYSTDNQFGTRTYYHRGSTPSCVDGVINVANLDYQTTNGLDSQHVASSRGPQIDIFAPGTFTIGASGDDGEFSQFDVPYIANENYRAVKITGTSMATGQVTGVLALALSQNPEMTPKDALEWVKRHADNDRIYDGTSGPTEANYSNHKALNGSPNRFLRSPYSTGYPVGFEQGATLE